MAGARVIDRSALPEGGQRPAAGRIEDHAAHLLSAALVQPVRPCCREVLYDSAALRRFAGVDLGRAPAPDETTILYFRHLLERHDLCGAMLEAVNRYLAARGIRIGTGTIVHATILHAPSSTKNATGTRVPEMHQTRKGNQWFFGMKAHIGVDSKQGHRALGVLDRGFRGPQAHAARSAARRRAQGVGLPRLSRAGRGDPQGRAARPGHASRRTRYKHIIDELQRRKNRTKARILAKVEHPFRILKRVFRFVQVRFRGLKKNHHHLCAAFALVNLYLHRKPLAPLGASCGQRAPRSAPRDRKTRINNPPPTS